MQPERSSPNQRNRSPRIKTSQINNLALQKYGHTTKKEEFQGQKRSYHTPPPSRTAQPLVRIQKRSRTPIFLRQTRIADILIPGSENTWTSIPCQPRIAKEKNAEGGQGARTVSPSVPEDLLHVTELLDGVDNGRHIYNRASAQHCFGGSSVSWVFFADRIGVPAVNSHLDISSALN